MALSKAAKEVMAELERKQKEGAEKQRLIRERQLADAAKAKQQNEAKIAEAKALFLAEARPLVAEADGEQKVLELLKKHATGLNVVGLSNWLFELNNPA
jgi:hypothetical protein